MFDVTQKPMLARLARDLPEGDVLCEPKWDGGVAGVRGTGPHRR